MLEGHVEKFLQCKVLRGGEVSWLAMETIEPRNKNCGRSNSIGLMAILY